MIARSRELVAALHWTRRALPLPREECALWIGVWIAWWSATLSPAPHRSLLLTLACFENVTGLAAFRRRADTALRWLDEQGLRASTRRSLFAVVGTARSVVGCALGALCAALLRLGPPASAASFLGATLLDALLRAMLVGLATLWLRAFFAASEPARRAPIRESPSRQKRRRAAP